MEGTRPQDSADPPRGERGVVSDDQRKLEYIKAVISIAGDDVRQVYLRVTGAIGLAVLFVTQLPFERLDHLSSPAKWLLAGGLIAAGGAAGLFFLYLSKMHIARVQMAQCLRSLDDKRIYELWHGSGEFWKRYRWAYVGANWLFALSVALLAVVFGALIGLIDV